MLIVTAQQMKEIENAAVEHNITMPRLMENAGSAAAALIRRKFPVENINCLVFSGRGNNGGDGIVVARKLREYGANVVLVLVQGEPRTPQAKQMFEFLTVQEIPVLYLDQQRERVESYANYADLIIDAIYGTSFHGSLTGQSLVATQMINEAPAAVISLDLPSGVTCDRGMVTYGSVKADLTIAFQLLKPLHVLPDSLAQCGEVQLVDIGIPPETYSHLHSHFSKITFDHVHEWLPQRRENTNKGDFGRVLAICGSIPYRGAAILAATGVLRTGAGLCVVAAPETVCTAVSAHLAESILQPLPCNSQGEIDFAAARPLLEKQLGKATAVLFGCGCGLTSSSLDILEFLIKHCHVPLVLDADALTLLGENLHLLSFATQPIILTPHPGEMATLANTSTAAVQANRMNTVLEFTEKYNVIVVLKGHGTLVALPDGRLYLNDTGNPGLARGGSGDVLVGMITSLLAQKLDPEPAAAAAVWLHGEAADRCAAKKSVQGMLPSDLFEELCEVFLDLER